MPANPLHAAHYADHACQTEVTVVENVRLARDTYRVRFEAPEIAQSIVPGQFLMLKLAGMDDPLLGRPLALYDTALDTSGKPTGLDVVYLVLGKMTRRLAEYRPGQRLSIWGPLGNGFPSVEAPGEHLLMVAGGIGQTPFMALAREALGLRPYGHRKVTHRAGKVSLLYGARTADYLAGVEDFEALGVEVRVSTDDGTRGHHGFVTDLLQTFLANKLEGPLRIICCGPEPMMEAVASIAVKSNVPCLVSLETPMACGIGICFSCVARVRDPSGDWDYKRTCVEGPVFSAQQIAW